MLRARFVRRAHVSKDGVLCTEGLDVIRKEAWSFYRSISGVRLCWELEEPGTRGGLEAGSSVRPEAHLERDWYLVAEQPAPAPHLAHPKDCAALRVVLVNVPGVSLC